MRVIVAGSRPRDGIPSRGDVFDAIDDARADMLENGEDITEIVSGGCRGPDRWGEEWARANRIPVRVFPAQWKTHGKKAGPLRNIEMAEYADVLVAVYDGESRGTKHMIDAMVERRKPAAITFARRQGTP